MSFGFHYLNNIVKIIYRYNILYVSNMYTNNMTYFQIHN